MEYRRADANDIESIAAIHAESWRQNYRGAYLDEFLDGNVHEDRRAIWTDRLTTTNPLHDTAVAVSHGEVVGFVHTILDHDPVWGALLDNLHVRSEAKRMGIGSRLMSHSAAAVVERASHQSLHLLVLEGNTAAQAFYRSRGGRCVGREVSVPAGGGTIVGLRFVWTDPTTLVAGPS